uniref:Uncharacterized protein n=1 Tax=Romanomermis culicivorax TaxID=13658 RepID=A0A915L5Q1_ROMCU
MKKIAGSHVSTNRLIGIFKRPPRPENGRCENVRLIASWVYVAAIVSATIFILYYYIANRYRTYEPPAALQQADFESSAVDVEPV